MIPESHKCHWPGCSKTVSPALFMCAPHWYKLPKYIQNMIWDTYVPRQEITKTPSDEYLKATRVAMDWIEKHSPIEEEAQKPVQNPDPEPDDRQGMLF